MWSSMGLLRLRREQLFGGSLLVVDGDKGSIYMV